MIIYLPNPTIGIHHQIVQALGRQPSQVRSINAAIAEDGLRSFTRSGDCFAVCGEGKRSGLSVNQ